MSEPEHRDFEGEKRESRSGGREVQPRLDLSERRAEARRVESPEGGEPEHRDFEGGYDPAALRLRNRARLLGAFIALASVLPYEVVGETPQFIWDLAGELSLAGLLAYLAPGIAGLVIIIAGFTIQRPLTLAVAVLAALTTATIMVQLGADAAAWDIMPLPESLGRRPGIPMAVLALTAAGAGLTFREHSRRLGQGMLIGAVALAALFYLIPARGEAPMDIVVRAFSSWDDVPDWRFQVGFIIIGVLVLWPALVAVGSLFHLVVPAGDDQPVASIVARYGLPLLLIMFIMRGVTGAGWNTFHGLGFALFLAGLVSVLASAVEVLAAGYLAPDPDQPTARPSRKALAVIGGVAGAALIAQAVLSLPPPKGVEWDLKPQTAEADAVFDGAMTTWNRARLRWDRAARGSAGREALLAVKNAARALVAEAREIDAGLADALERFTRESRTLGLAGRKWFRLIGEVNTAIRAAGLPYYLDPSVITFRRAEGRRRHFRMRTFVVESVSRYDVDGDAFATLRVRRLGGGRSDGSLLGFSRDMQRFALVLLPELESFRDTLRDGAAADPPTCQPDKDDTGALFDAVSGGQAGVFCGQLLARVVEALGDTIDAQAAAVVDRHELQHQIDGPDLPIAGRVRARFSRRGEDWRKRVNREFSSYIAQMTAPDAEPHLGVVHLARLAIGETARRVYPATALLVLEAMTGHAIIEDDGRNVDRAELAQAISALSGMRPEAIRAKAAATWAHEFGSDLPPIKVLPVSLPQ